MMTMTEMTAEAPDFQVFDKVTVTTDYGQIPFTITGIPMSSGYAPARRGHRCEFDEDCRYLELQDATGRLLVRWSCQVAPVAPVSTAPAPAATVTIRPARTPDSTIRQHHPMTPVVKGEKRPTRYATGRVREECWAATSTNGRWRYERVDDTGSPWQITCVPTGRALPDRVGTLDRARAETYRLDHAAQTAAA